MQAQNNYHENRRCSDMLYKLTSFTWFLLINIAVKAQDIKDTTIKYSKTVIAGKQYQRSSLHQKFWGAHYRREWTTPVSVPLFYLDTAAGGLKPYASGGGRQTKTLRLRNTNGKEYVLRSIDKTFDQAFDTIYRNTFVETVVNDQVSTAHPYAAVVVAPLAEAAGIYHTWPQIVYVPKQQALDSFNEEFGDDLYLFEQRPDGNWQEAINFGNTEEIVSTEKLLQNLLDSNEHIADQSLFVKARLFDIFLGDWGRHEDQWRWATFKTKGETLYKPIPRDRDQAFTKFDGTLLKFGLSAAGLGHLQSFENTVDDVTTYNFPARNLDRRLANELSLMQWVTIAKELQQTLTDNIIEISVKALPKEVFSISGPDIIANLKNRRNGLVRYATDYYRFLAKEVDITASKQREHFVIKRLSDEETEVNIYKIGQDGNRNNEPYYSRIFKSDETKELRLYGIAGSDVYDLSGNVSKGVKIRIIGGIEKDDINDASSVAGTKSVHIYDSGENSIINPSSTKLHISTNTSINNYQYDAFKYSAKGFKPSIFFNNEDRLFAGIGYEITKQQWRKEPFGYKHVLFARYSLTQKGMSFTYKGVVNNFIRKWNLDLLAYYDAVRWTNFFGVGNETKELTDDRDFYRMRTHEALVSIGLSRKIGNSIIIGATPFFQWVDVIRDEERFVVKSFSSEEGLNTSKRFAGTGIHFLYSRLRNDVIPVGGIELLTGATFTQNIQTAQNFNRYTGAFNFYFSLSKRLVLAVRSGGATITGNPEFYQLTSIGGTETVRGYRRDRFWGKNSFYNSNELQWLFNVRSYLFNGRAGFVGFFDQGRVWQPSEESTTWHNGYGGGIMFAPFNKLVVSITYGVSKENGLLHVQFRRALRK